MSIKFNPDSSSSQNAFPLNNVAQSQTTLLSWMHLVSFHAKSSSVEDVKTLQDLSQNIPIIDYISEEMKEVIARVQQVAANKTFDPQLSLKSQQLCELIHQQLNQLPKCAIKLNSSLDNEVTMSMPKPTLNAPQPQHNILSWLELVAFHSQSSSFEDLRNLENLVRNIPPVDTHSSEIDEIIESLKNVTKNKEFDPKLSPKSKKIYTSMRLEWQEKPKCARKLDFSDC